MLFAGQNYALAGPNSAALIMAIRPPAKLS